jgi:hypothetical protein
MPAKKRVLDALVTPNKRTKVAPRGTASQPVVLSPPRRSPRKPLVEASQATDFESQLRESQAEDAIIAPEEGSEEATVASSQDAPEELADKGFDVHLEDNFNGID